MWAQMCFSVAQQYCTPQVHMSSKRPQIGRIHGAIVAATGRSDRRGDRGRDNRRDDRLVYTLQAIVAATIASWLLD